GEAWTAARAVSRADDWAEASNAVAVRAVIAAVARMSPWTRITRFRPFSGLDHRSSRAGQSLGPIPAGSIRHGLTARSTQWRQRIKVPRWVGPPLWLAQHGSRGPCSSSCLSARRWAML